MQGVGELPGTVHRQRTPSPRRCRNVVAYPLQAARDHIPRLRPQERRPPTPPPTQKPIISRTFLATGETGFEPATARHAARIRVLPRPNPPCLLGFSVSEFPCLRRRRKSERRFGNGVPLWVQTARARGRVVRIDLRRPGMRVANTRSARQRNPGRSHPPTSNGSRSIPNPIPRPRATPMIDPTEDSDRRTAITAGDRRNLARHLARGSSPLNRHRGKHACAPASRGPPCRGPSHRQ